MKRILFIYIIIVFFSSCNSKTKFLKKDSQIFVYGQNSNSKLMQSLTVNDLFISYKYFNEKDSLKNLEIFFHKKDSTLIWENDVYKESRLTYFNDKLKFKHYTNHNNLNTSHAIGLIFNKEYGLLCILHDRYFLFLKDSVLREKSEALLRDIIYKYVDKSHE